MRVKRIPSKPYQPIDELLENMRVRVLRAVAWRTHDGEWASSADIMLALGVEETGERRGSKERNRAEVTLRRLVEAGLVERRGEKQSYAFRVTGRGRAEVARYRAGELPQHGGRRAA